MTNLYKVLIDNLPENIWVKNQVTIDFWIITELSNGGIGCCARITEERSSLNLCGMEVKEAAKYLLSDLPSETVCGLSVINAYYNNPESLRNLNCETDIEAFCTDGFDFQNKTIGMLGHMGRTAEHIREYSKLYIFEFNPKPGDYPAEAEKDMLPECDIVIMTGTTISNHTLEGVLEMSPNAKHILLGPSVPLCDKITGIDRLSGNLISDKDGFISVVESSQRFPVKYARSFNLDL